MWYYPHYWSMLFFVAIILVSLSDPPFRKEEAVLERERNDREKKRLASIQMAEQNKKVRIKMDTEEVTTPEQYNTHVQTQKGYTTRERDNSQAQQKRPKPQQGNIWQTVVRSLAVTLFLLRLSRPENDSYNQSAKEGIQQPFHFPQSLVVHFTTSTCSAHHNCAERPIAVDGTSSAPGTLDNMHLLPCFRSGAEEAYCGGSITLLRIPSPAKATSWLHRKPAP